MFRLPLIRPRAPSEVTLVLANLVPLIGVLFLGWNLLEVVLVFWAESAVIGLFNIAKMIRIDPGKGSRVSLFFIVHYGIFMVGHAAFIVTIFAPVPKGGHLFQEPSVAVVVDALAPATPAILAMFVSHGVSFVTNFLRQHQYEQTTVDKQMFAPYKRIMVMQFVIIFGGWLVDIIGEPVAALVVLVAIKTTVDLFAHKREHTDKDRAAAIGSPG